MTKLETSHERLVSAQPPRASRYIWFRLIGAPFYLSALFFALVEPTMVRVFGKGAINFNQRCFSSLIRIFVRLNGLSIEVVGNNPLQREDGRPRVIMATHKGRLDAYILYALLPFRFKMFWSTTSHVLNEGFGSVVWTAKRLDLYFTHDKSNRRVTVREFWRAEDWVRNGNTLVFFPEGTNTPEHELEKLGRACINLAIRSGADVQPVIISGSSHGFERKTGSLFRPAKARVEFPSAIPASSVDAESLHQQVQHTLLSGLAKHRALADDR
jgi:1-acyl-sn-glycerol-3-phosphate acyltransferase